MSLRVAFVAGTLAPGGSERQMWYLARALKEHGAEVSLCSLTRDAYFESEFRTLGIHSSWVGRLRNPAARTLAIASTLRKFRPHIVQSMHSFVNLHATIAARILGAAALGSLRCDLRLARADNGRWAPWLLRVPDALVVNSRKIRAQIIAARLQPPDCVYYLPNRVDAGRFESGRVDHDGVTAIFVGRLLQSKRLDCFLRALSIARVRRPGLNGLVVGDGPELVPMRRLAAELGLGVAVQFLGKQEDLPSWFAQSDLLVLSSDTEGSPNVVLEAMAAGLPVIATPAGDAGYLVRRTCAGFVVGFADVNAIAERLVDLASSPQLRNRLGESARRGIAREFTPVGLAERYAAICDQVARRKRNPRGLGTAVGDTLV